MRTRSQPASPGGLVSLEDMKRATRRTRTTRSASRGASQEPSSQETIEPAPQPAPATRARTQRTVKKTTTTTTTKKDTSTASSAADSAPVTSTSTKNKTQKAPKRTTRKGTRKTGKSAADEPQESIGEQYNDAAEAKYRENAKFANEQTGSGSSKVDSALSEQNNSEINRKRSRSEASPDHQDGPATPSANKRRNLGAPGSTPFARHRTPLVRRLSTAVPYSERLRRRRAESQGRIHSTIFRLPQLVAQTEADRLASQTSPPVPPPAEPLNPDLNLSTSLDQTDEQAVPEQSFVTQEPTTPESTRRGWNISGLIQSVPRSFSRFLPRFGRSPASSQASAIPEPSSERIQRTQPSEGFSAPAAENESQPRRRSTDQPPAKRPRNYSLFPNPIDRNLYLGDLTSKPASTIPAVSSPASAFASSSTSTSNNQLPAALSESSQPQPSTTPVVERGRDITPQARNLASESHKKKRKRSPSPDVIPNPEGSSYGMDLRYFTYSSEDEDEEADQASTEPKSETKLPDTLVKIAARNIVGTEKPSSKKVRFDASPEDTPSKQRARATDPYHGRHFIGMNAPPIFSAPTTPTPTPRVVDPRQRPGFIPNRSGTFELDYDAFSDDSDSSGAPSPPSVSTPAAAQASISTQPSTPTSAPSPAARTTARPTQTPSTPAKFDEEALARARSQAEKYKPKTPSGLRTASRYSSPLTAITPDLTPVPTEKIVEKFGD
ncbi:hypothetical protein BJY04DRAFT_195313, partial [Aspergillus karnatakaensis]|uniref:uncharacterized protein n=1 Tax=Aspergillus karnatakaensis TaxID=1810916 RepID=UPI003CCDC647